MKAFLSENQKSKLTNDTIIRSYYFEEEDILKAIMKLYCPQGFDLDPTYNKGSFYKNVPRPSIKMDLSPQTRDCIQANVIDLPIKSEFLNSIIFDPPFLTRILQDPKKKKSIICNRFSHYSSSRELLLLYRRSLKEFYRVLKTKGILVFKCQDVVIGKNVFYHIKITNMAEKIGFILKDLFLKLSKNVPIRGKYHRQVFARKFHSYFLIFEKE